MAVYMAFSMESRMNTLVPFIMGVILMTFQFFRLCDQPALGSEVYRIPVTMSLASMLVLFLVGIIVATAERLGNTMHFRETGEVLTSYWDQSLPWVNALLFVVPFTYVYSSLLLSRSSRRQ
jgi:hypothetical protein